MTHLLNALRPARMPYMQVKNLSGTLTPVSANGRAVTRDDLHNTMTKFHIVKCDCQMCGAPSHRHSGEGGKAIRTHPCLHETRNEPIPDHETYVPDGWGIYPDGTHKCPDCRTKRSLDRERKYREDLIAKGVTVKQLRAAMQSFYGNEPNEAPDENGDPGNYGG